ncbi:MAG: OmpA family protein [Deltaproteobacteria bacterium]
MPNKSSPLLKIVAAVLAIIALFTVAVLGTCVYLGYRVKHKVTEMAKEIKEGRGQAGSGSAPKVETRPYAECEYKDRTGFDDFAAAAGKASIPLKAGLTLTNIWPDPKLANNDVEILITVAGIHSSTIEVSGMRLDGKSPPGGRTLCIADMLNAREYETGWGGDTPNTIAGATMFSLSKQEFEDLKAGRPAAFAFYDAHDAPNRRYTLAGYSKGALSRVESDDVPYSAIVNGDQKSLPTIHAKGDLSGNPFEAWVLDDPANPLVLKFVNTKNNWHITYVKITFPVEKKIEQELAQQGRAEIYGIYFDFNSATLRPESGPVLKEISEALKNNPSWKIKIDGHTDNIGGDAYNLQLSQRRAEAVKQALIKEYGITADRMTPEGFGASRPKATNATVEGRALNRRVELVRE